MTLPASDTDKASRDVLAAVSALWYALEDLEAAVAYQVWVEMPGLEKAEAQANATALTGVILKSFGLAWRKGRADTGEGVTQFYRGGESAGE